MRNRSLFSPNGLRNGLRTPTLCLIGAALAGVGGTRIATAQEKLSSGKMAIPAQGLFSLKEGTVEAWVQFHFNPVERVEGYTARGQLFLMRIPKSDNDLGAEMSVFFASLRHTRASEKDRSFTFLRAGFAIDGKEVPHPIVVPCDGWKAGEWHHVAVSWENGRRLTVYFDGKLAMGGNEPARVEFPYSIERDIPRSAQIILGSEFDQAVNDLSVDEFRLSSVARDEKNLGFSSTPLRPDPLTMLLENFDDAAPAIHGARYTTRPAVMVTSLTPQSYDLSAGRIIPGKAGQAWKISPRQ